MLTCITPGSSVDILVTDHGIAVNPARPELAERLQEAGIKVVSIEWLRERARLLTGEPQPIEFTDRVVAVVRYPRWLGDRCCASGEGISHAPAS